jgi:hypothetical protein
MTFSCIIGCGEPSSVRLLARWFHESPTTPSAADNCATARISRSPTAGRRTIIVTTPSSLGERRTSCTAAASSSAVA